MRKKLLVIVLVILGLVLLGTGIFFIQKYWRLYLKYKNFLGAQEVYYKLDILEGKQPQFKEWTFKKYLQLLKEGEEKGKKLIEEHEAALKALREDTVGGKTPEETLQGFVEALKKRDFDLASKYMILEEQNKFRRELDEYSEERIEKIISSLDKAYTIWEKELDRDDKKSYRFNTEINDEEVSVRIEFKFNPYSNVWKIESF